MKAFLVKCLNDDRITPDVVTFLFSNAGIRATVSEIKENVIEKVEP